MIILEANFVKYAVTQDVNNTRNATTIRVDTSQFNHIGFRYTNNNLTMWLNGKQKQTHENVNLDRMYKVSIGGSGDLGILSLYDKGLNKQEIVQHFIDYHVQILRTMKF